MTNPAGRPSSYKEDYPDVLFNLMKDGLKGAHLHAHFGVNRKTFWEWRKKYPEFNDAYERGMEQCQKWWEQFGIQKMLEGDEKGYKYWKDFMSNNFNWNKNIEPCANTQINIGSMNVFQGQTKQELISYIEEQLKELPVINVEYKQIESNNEPSE